MSQEPPKKPDAQEAGSEASEALGDESNSAPSVGSVSAQPIDEQAEADVETPRPFEGAFLGEIRERLATRRGGIPSLSEVPTESGEDESDALSTLTESLPDSTVEDVETAWSTLKADIALRRSASGIGVDRKRPRRVQRHQAATSLRDNFQVHVLAMHGFATFILLGIGLGVIISAATHFVPPKFWLLGLPLILLAIAGVLPLAGWVIGFWNPQQV